MMRQNLSVLFFVFIALFVPSVLFAEELNLSGVMNGDHPTAIVNDKVVGVGDSIGNDKVVEIESDHVVFEGTSGRSTLFLKEEKVAKPVPKAKVGIPENEKTFASTEIPKDKTSIDKAPMSEKSRKHLNSSLEYLGMGDELLKSKLKFDELYVQAASLCANAEREAQEALSGVSDDAQRVSIREHIDQIRKAQAAIMREKADLNTRFRSAIAAGKILPGMSAQNVIESWGPPLSKTDIGKVQKWTYKNSEGYQSECVFNNGVLISF